MHELSTPRLETAHPTDARAAVRSLAGRLATAPGLVRVGVSSWDAARTPIRPLSLERAFADPALLRDLGVQAALVAESLDADVVVGAVTAGVPLAVSASMVAELPFAFVRKPGYRGHETDEPPVRGADVSGRRVLLADDGIWRGNAVEHCVKTLAGMGAEVEGVFCLVDMREVADTVTPTAASLPTWSVASYLQLLDLATVRGVLEPSVHDLSVDAIVNRWAQDDPRWGLLPLPRERGGSI
jgi:orotate phosphoribosyltransferase